MTNASKKESKQLTNKYSPSEFVKNVYSLAMTKITMPQARFVRRPIFLRGGGITRGSRRPYNRPHVPFRPGWT